MISSIFQEEIWSHNLFNLYRPTQFLYVILRMSFHNANGYNMSSCEGSDMYSMCVQQVLKSNHVLKTSVSNHYISLKHISWCLQDACASGTSARIGMASWISHGWRDSKWLCVSTHACVPTACWYEWIEMYLAKLAPPPLMLTLWPLLTGCGCQEACRYILHGAIPCTVGAEATFDSYFPRLVFKL